MELAGQGTLPERNERMTPIQLEQKTQLEEFERQGFLSVPNALTPAQISAFNRKIDVTGADRQRAAADFCFR